MQYALICHTLIETKQIIVSLFMIGGLDLINVHSALAPLILLCLELCVLFADFACLSYRQHNILEMLLYLHNYEHLQPIQCTNVTFTTVKIKKVTT